MPTAPQSVEEIRERVAAARREHIEYMIEEFIPYIMTTMSFEGYNVNGDDTKHELTLFIDSFRSLAYKTQGMYHPLHELTRDIATFPEMEESRRRKQ